MLTQKQKLYAEARVAGENQTRAAIAAGYSEKTAGPAASRLEKEPDVQAHIQRLRDAAINHKAQELSADQIDPLEYMKSVVSCVSEDPRFRLEAAKALAPYLHAKKGEMGKKELKQQDADNIKAGRFGLRAVK